MYAEYLREREDKQILEIEHGFTVYGYNCVPGMSVPHVYIKDNYVRPEHRKTGIARTMADQICAEAKTKGIKILLGSVDGGAHGAHESLLVLIAYGMKLYSINDNAIWMAKEI